MSQSHTLQLDDCIVDLQRGLVHREGEPLELTTLERALLVYLAERPSVVVSRDQLLRDVWEHKGRILDDRKPDYTMARLRAKVERDKARPRHLLTVHGTGYRFEPATKSAPPRATAEVPPPGAAYSSAWHARRPHAERVAARYVAQPGAPLVLIGPSGMGKSWLLRHIVHTHEAVEDQSVFVAPPASAEGAVNSVVVDLAFAVGVDERVAVEAAQGAGAPSRRIARVLERQILPAVVGRLLVVFDQLEAWPDVPGGGVHRWMADWAERRGAPWDRVRWLAGSSTEPVVRIDQPELSSMHLVPPIYLDDLSADEVAELAAKHHAGWTEAQLASLHDLVGGHPLLVRSALYQSLEQGPDKVLALADAPEGALGHWLRKQWRVLQASPDAAALVRSVMEGRADTGDFLLAHRLQRAGILAPRGAGWTVRYAVLERFLRNVGGR